MPRKKAALQEAAKNVGGRPRAAPARTKFGKWIDRVGAKQIAEALGDVTMWTVYAWRRGAESQIGRPRPDPSRLGALLRLADGELTAADIFPEAR